MLNRGGSIYFSDMYFSSIPQLSNHVMFNCCENTVNIKINLTWYYNLSTTPKNWPLSQNPLPLLTIQLMHVFTTMLWGRGTLWGRRSLM